MDDFTKTDSANPANVKHTAGRWLGGLAGDWLMLGLALWMVWASFSVESEAYDFPRMVALLLLVFAFVNIVQVMMRASLTSPTSPSPISLAILRRLFPAVCIVAVYIYVCDIIGFYWAALPSFVLLAACYGAPLRGGRQWGILALATVLVMGSVYVLFDVVLQVQTPEPFWID